ncbi:uncharacterized protein LOC108734054 [Agrilus planipennis]|uniref:Uncharacterized protein LOC108734054 n=1 Tax=Agrilus planipennis TaxID=224129 RepID=A0A1W4WKG0_AGRPL|nr:uncharacterized protein LOC108734054 [Agrilus planipennis]
MVYYQPTNQPTNLLQRRVGSRRCLYLYVVAASPRPVAFESTPDSCSSPLTCFSETRRPRNAAVSMVGKAHRKIALRFPASRRPLTTWHLGATFSPSDNPLVETATARRYRWTKIGPLRFHHPRGLSAPSRGGETRTGVTSLMCPTPLLQVGQRAIESDDVENPRAEDLERRGRGRTCEDSHRGPWSSERVPR